MWLKKIVNKYCHKVTKTQSKKNDSINYVNCKIAIDKKQMKIFSIDEINNKLIELNSWQFINNTIEKEFVLNDFRDSLAFAVKIGIEAEKMDHHPDLLLHGWNKVKVTLTTHSAGGVTENDIKLAQTIDKITR